MPEKSLATLRPGVQVQASQSLVGPGYYGSNLIRWMEGLPQKIGGWQRISPNQLVGKARGMLGWADLTGTPYLIVGTDQRVELLTGGTLEDVTPLRATVNIVVDFSTVIGSPTVTIKDVAHGSAAGDWIYLVTPVSVGGLVIQQYQQIASIVDADNYTITFSDNATATVNNGGAVPVFDTTNGVSTVDVTLADHGLAVNDIFDVEIATIVGGLTVEGQYLVTSITDPDTFVITDDEPATSNDTAAENTGQVRILYLLGVGNQSAEALTGYGIGDYGDGDYGLSGANSGLFTTIRQWFWSQWGEQALGNYTNGGFYAWIPPFATGNRAVIVSGAPTINTASFVAMPQQIAVALGAEVLSDQDPNLVRWCAVADYNDWVASSTNQAGSFRIPSGSRIVGGVQGPQQALIWTDLDAWAMTYLSTPFIFGFIKIGDGCGLIAARARAVLGNEVYWMSSQGFFKNGANGVVAIQCDVWDIVFQNLANTQVDKITAAPNSGFNEICFFFPPADGGDEAEPTKYVKLSVLEKGQNGQALWDYGDLDRLAWIDQSPLGTPIGADNSGFIQQHEVGNDADGSAMNAWFETGFMDIAEGGMMSFVDQVIPDFKRSAGSTIYFTPKSQKFPNGAVKTYTTKNFTDGTNFLNWRIKGQQFAFRIGSNDLGSFWRMGKIRYRHAPDGMSAGIGA